MKIYFAGALFSTAEKDFNLKLKLELNKINPDLEILLPQEKTKLFIDENDFEEKVFNTCISGVDNCDVVLAILDGADVDSGTSVELGYAYAKKKKIIGIRTDFRALEYKGLNIMVYKILDYYIFTQNNQNSVKDLAEQVNEVLKKL